MANSPFGPDQRTLAKTLMVVTGNATRTREILSALWGSDAADASADPARLPAERTLTLWKNDPSIPIDEEFAREFSDRQKVAVMGAASRLAERLEGTMNVAIDRYETKEGNALDILNVAKSLGIVHDKLNGRHLGLPALPEGGNVFNGPVQIVAWAAKEVPSREVEVLSPGAA